MPIEIPLELRRPSQNEFAEIAYRVMGSAFQAHRSIGRFFREQTYKRLVAQSLSNVELEVPIVVRHRNFRKDYFIDMIVDRSAIFEWKAGEELCDKHRAQLLNYMLLVEMPHGKLINVGKERIQHEFVNTKLTKADRLSFEVDESKFIPLGQSDRQWQEFLVSAVLDWGAGLDLALYEDAITFCCGGEDVVIREIEVMVDDVPIGRQTVPLTPTGAAFKVTAYSERDSGFAEHASRFLKCTRLPALHWINVTLRKLTFRTLFKET